MVEDIVEQLALADLLHKSQKASVRRVALIVTDNAVEVMLKIYVEFEKGIDFFGITSKSWKEMKRASAFKHILHLVVSKPGVEIDEKLILGYHDTRDQLYHDPKLLTIETKNIGKYLTEAKSLANQLFALNFSNVDWSNFTSNVTEAVFSKVATPIRVIRKEDGTLKLEGIIMLNDTEVVAVAMQKFLENEGKYPSFIELKNLLISGGKSPSNLSDRISNLRKRGLVKRNELALTPSGQKTFMKFLVA